LSFYFTTVVDHYKTIVVLWFSSALNNKREPQMFDTATSEAKAQSNFDRQVPNYGDTEAEARREAKFVASAMQDIVAGLQRDDKIAADMGEQFLMQSSNAEVGELFRLAFAGDAPALLLAFLKHAGKAVGVLGEIEGMKQAEDARYA
jgi:hypothetical protein